MKELNDKDFDQAFKQRITESFPEFEEESWLKMEKKLRRNDRLVFLRNASIILLFLSFGLGFYLFNKKDEAKVQNTVVKNKPSKNTEQKPVATPVAPIEKGDGQQVTLAAITPLYKAMASHINKLTSPQQVILPLATNGANDNNTTTPLPSANTDIAAVVTPSQPNQTTEQAIDQELSSPVVPDVSIVSEKPIKAAKRRYKIPISLAISAGPDFNSTEALVGGKTSMALGVNVGVGLTQKLSVQTGLIYGAKNYNAKGYNYTFNNPNVQSIIESIQAACKVLEIPLRASYRISENQNRFIEVNGGLSSYLMLKENYVYKYTVASGRKDRTNEFTNANQHFLSVVDLSATYNIKLKNKKMALGIEPYVKIPLSGVGEGNVPLKSSGVSFKLRYDFNKK